jgi:ubiquitin C-terminal hydrolase
LDNFLENLSFVNNTAPIVVNGYIEIGIVIKLPGTSTSPTPPPPPPPPPPITNKSRQEFNSKPLIGFENIGATCYMNATLQCICNIEKFVDYFKYSKHLFKIVKEDIKKEKLCSQFKIIIEKLYPDILSNKYNISLKKNWESFFPPTEFKETISRMNPLFEGIAANDAKDLVNFLIMTLHAESNRASPEEINMGNLLQDQTNKQLMFQNFASNFTKTHQSIISDIFYAMNCNVTQCLNCGVTSYNYQIYFFLIFPLEEVRKFVLMNNGGFNNNFNTNMVNIYDCFNFDRKINSKSGDNAMYCNYCKQTCASQMCTNLTTGPEVLIIILNRGKGIEFNVKINFCLDLDLSNYIEFRNTGCQYELVGVITHIGESSMSGHFIAYCKSYWDNKWYKFNDAIVSPVNDFKTEVIDFAMPYLLFYQKKNI